MDARAGTDGKPRDLEQDATDTLSRLDVAQGDWWNCSGGKKPLSCLDELCKLGSCVVVLSVADSIHQLWFLGLETRKMNTNGIKKSCC